MIYELNKQVEEALEKYYDSQDLETGEIIDEEAFNESKKELQELQNKKDDLIEWALKKRANKLSQFEGINSEIKRLTDLKKSIEKQVNKSDEFIKYLTKDVLENNKKVIISNWEIGYRLSKGVVTEEDFTEKEYMKEKITITIDKVKLKKDIDNGKEIPGAFIEERRNFFIK